MRMDETRLLQIYEQLESEHQQWNTRWEEAVQYVQPSRLGYISHYAPGQKKTIFIYDSIGIQCVDDLSNYLSATLTPAGTDWFRIKFADDPMNSVDEAKEWLDECHKIMWRHIQNSNFQAATAEVNKDLCVGTACDEVMPQYDRFGDFVGIHYGFIHMREMRGMENQYGEIDMTFRIYKEATARMWYEKFGDAAGEKVVNAIKVGRPNTKVKFLHAVYPREVKDVDPAAWNLGDAPSHKLPYASVWMNMDNKKIVREGGFYERSRNITRWNSNTDNIFGHGPALNALPDIRTLNEAKRLQLVAYEKAIDPPLKSSVDDENTDMDIGAGGNTYLNNMDSLQPLYEGTKWDLVLLKDGELRSSIERSFFVDLIREPLGDSGPQKTMYEVARRLERAQRILGEATGRIRNERLKWIVERTFSILYREGQFPEVPPVLAEAGAALDVRYVSPLATAQATTGLDSMRNALVDLASMAEIRSAQDPGAWAGWDRVDDDGWVNEVFDKHNVPASATRDVKQAQVLREERAEKEAAAATLEAIESASKSAKNLSGVEGPGLEMAEQLAEGGG